MSSQLYFTLAAKREDIYRGKCCQQVILLCASHHCQPLGGFPAREQGSGAAPCCSQWWWDLDTVTRSCPVQAVGSQVRAELVLWCLVISEATSPPPRYVLDPAETVRAAPRACFPGQGVAHLLIPKCA